MLFEVDKKNKQLLIEKKKMIQIFMEQVQKLERERDHANVVRTQKNEDLLAANKLILILETEKDKLKQKFIKLKRRKNVDLN